MFRVLKIVRDAEVGPRSFLISVHVSDILLCFVHCGVGPSANLEKSGFTVRRSVLPLLLRADPLPTERPPTLGGSTPAAGASCPHRSSNNVGGARMHLRFRARLPVRSSATNALVRS